ncbi:hypothetical protein IWZ03DRAFT_364601 [Phyllosticta citriasiana]|uniref:Hydantoinase n=1 Tax=Phyllosticta citriasiana TaxID=595635 RepID=A0ABR1KZ28_9PEZI
MTAAKRLRIGIDVGGTNTDGVVIDPLRASEPDKGIIAWHKAPTTADPSHGIEDALRTMFEQSKVNPDEVASVTIGTTHFVNAVVERDARRLAKVAVIRLSGSFGKHAPPCIDWPEDLRDLVLGHHAQVSGGLEVDGRTISDPSPDELTAQADTIRALGIPSVVLIGTFSPLSPHQEHVAAEIMRPLLPASTTLTLSSSIAALGFLERENASILNASILPFARRTIARFHAAVRNVLGSAGGVQVFVTQNDGTVLRGAEAARCPIRTFSSGPTNSMRGAAVLVGEELASAKNGTDKKKREPCMVVDVGGTTTDVGLLLANGFPRQKAAYSEFAGVRMNFSCPDVRSIGLGGGSVVRVEERSGTSRVTVGPDSVGYRIQEEALVFGGKIPTATDYTVASDEAVEIGDRAGVKGLVGEKEALAYRQVVKKMLEKVIDTMKTSPDDIAVLLVGGGAVIAPETLKGASRVLKPKFAGVANAIGAAMAGVSAVVDTVKSTDKKTTKEVLEEVSKEAIEKTVEAGAARETVKIAEMDTLPLPYIANKCRFIVRAAGEYDFSRVYDSNEMEEEQVNGEVDEKEPEKTLKEPPSKGKPTEEIKVDIATYRPKVVKRVWYVSETDLAWISCGCYILGTGGGGSPYSHMLRLRSILRSGAVVRVVSPDDLKDEDQVGCGGGSGSPTVGIEKLQGDEMMEAQMELYGLARDKKATHMIALEIGGGNGLQGMILGASSNMNIPTVDGDWMGRAYPTKWQTTPVVFAERKTIFCPISMCDGNGNVVFMTKATSDETVERVFRAGLSELGSHVGCAEGPVTGAETRRWAVEHTISLSWRIGRAVHAAQQSNSIDTVAESIVAEVGGSSSAKVLFKGKIVGVERTLRRGHIYGEVIIEAADVNDSAAEGPSEYDGRIVIPFKNENIAVFKEKPDGGRDTLAIVPDLISIIDAQNGEAIGTPEYRYGLLVIVLGITASERWTSTERGVELGGPKAFGMDDLEYKPIGKFQKPRSVIDEYSIE